MTGAPMGELALSLVAAIRASSGADTVAVVHQRTTGTRVAVWEASGQCAAHTLRTDPTLTSWLIGLPAAEISAATPPAAVLAVLGAGAPQQVLSVRVAGHPGLAVVVSWDLAPLFPVSPTILTAVAHALGDAAIAQQAWSRMHQRLARARRDARTDALTGVGNRRRWDEALVHADEQLGVEPFSAAIGVIDLTGLKAINDAHGHAEGDRLIRRTAALLTEASPPWTCLARTGGDEFAVLITRSPIGRYGIRDRIVHLLQAGEVAAAVGAAVRAPRQPLADVWDEADADMYRAAPPLGTGGSDWSDRT